MSTFEKVFKDNQYNVQDAARKSQTWFQQQARLLGRQQVSPLGMIKSNPEHNVARIIPGEMYLFMYDAKHQEKLPYWDMFPMVFPFRKMPDGFIGLNLHYLPYQMRIRLLDRLMEFRTNKSLNENTRLRYSWATIQGSSKLKIAEPCVHRYLMSQVQSPFKKIEAKDWTTALMLPVERFVGSTKQRVWTESLKT
jgi:hypothetical protein